MYRVVLLAVTCLAVSLNAQNDVVTYHDLKAIAWGDRGSMKLKAVLGESGSVAIAQFPVGLRGNPHYHTQEQIVLSLGGALETTMGGVPYRMNTYGAVVTRSNDEHFTANTGNEPATFIEFQPIRRTDWLPPYPSFISPKATAPVTYKPEDRPSGDFSLSSTGWKREEGGARSKVLSGDAIRMTMWDLSAPNASVSLNPKGARPEQFVYVIQGQVEVSVDSKPRTVSADSVALVAPAAGEVWLRSAGSGPALVAVFESIQR